MEVVLVWVEAALRLGEKDFRVMERLLKAQDRLSNGLSGVGGMRGKDTPDVPPGAPPSPTGVSKSLFCWMYSGQRGPHPFELPLEILDGLVPVFPEFRRPGPGQEVANFLHGDRPDLTGATLQGVGEVGHQPEIL